MDASHPVSAERELPTARSPLGLGGPPAPRFDLGLLRCRPGGARIMGITLVASAMSEPSRLIHGALSVLTHAKEPAPWNTELRQCRLLNVAVVALANKMARTIRALLAHEWTYQIGFVSQSA